MRKIEVFHLRDDVPYLQREALCEDANALQVAYANGSFRHVATCSVAEDDPVAALNDAFRMTNSIDCPWVEDCSGVDLSPAVLQIGGCRSTSVGDLMRLDDVMYQVRGMGFASIEGFSH